MKDYRLSEIKKECIKNNGNCAKCCFGKVIGIHKNVWCIRMIHPLNWQIDEKDGEDE